MSDKPNLSWKTMRRLWITLFILGGLFAAVSVEKAFVVMSLPENTKPFDAGEAFGSAAGYAFMAIASCWIGARMRRKSKPPAPQP
jgi:hypothetical protein